MGLEIFGVFLAAMIQGVMISIYGTMVSCDKKIIEDSSYFNSSISSIAKVNETTSSHEYNKLVKE